MFYILIPQTFILFICLFFVGVAAFGKPAKQDVVKIDAIVIKSPHGRVFNNLTTQPPMSISNKVLYTYTVQFTNNGMQYTRLLSSKHLFFQNDKTFIYIKDKNVENPSLNDPRDGISFLAFARPVLIALFVIILIMISLPWIIYYKFKSFTCILVLINFAIIITSLVGSFLKKK